MKYDVNGALARQALAALHEARPKQWEVVELVAKGKTQEEIAAVLGIKQPAVSRRFAAAQRSLKQIVAELAKGPQ